MVRGPCYLALRCAVEAPWRPDGVVVLSEPGRALGSRDVAAVLGVGVVATVGVDPDVARRIDAGLVLAGPRALRPFRYLVRLVAPDLLHSVERESPAATPPRPLAAGGGTGAPTPAAPGDAPSPPAPLTAGPARERPRPRHRR